MDASVATNAVIGFPLKHTLSPALHNAFYKKNSINADMHAMEAADIRKLVQAIRILPIALTAVTLPHKQTIMPLLDEVDEVAKEIGAVNTVINRDGKLYGYNTDVVGVAKTFNGIDLKNKNVLVVGAGGAAQAVGYYLKQQQAHIFCVNRTKDKAEQFVQKFGGTVIIESEILSQSFDVIINTTPIGMSPKTDESPVPAEIFKPNQTVFDIVYNPLETKFLREANARGAKTLSGLTMFVEQGLAQEALWLGREVVNERYNDVIILELNRLK